MLRGERDGATSVEFAVLVSLLAIALLAGAALYGYQLDGLIASVAGNVETVGQGTNPGGTAPGSQSPTGPGNSGGQGNNGGRGNACQGPGNGNPPFCPN
jgi:Flp pilus assembly pilin Flp